MRYSYNIKNLSCANCAKKLEDALNKDEKINSRTKVRDECVGK